MDVSGRGPGAAPVERGLGTAGAGRWERLPFGLLLLAVWTAALLGIALLATGGLSGLAAALGRGAAEGPPRYEELTAGDRNVVLGRDLLIAPADATPTRIEDLVATVAAQSPDGLLRLNV